MKRKKKQNKPDRKRGIKSWLSIGAVALVSVITLGIVAALISPVAASSGPSGSGGGNSGSSTGSVSKPNVEDAPVVSYRLFNELYFDESYCAHYLADEKYIPGLKIGEKFNYGMLDTSNGYLKYSVNEYESDVYYSEFSVYLSGLSTSENEVSIGMNTMDYLVIDFDVWSDSEYFEEMYLTFNHGEDDYYQFGISNLRSNGKSYGTWITNVMVHDMFKSTDDPPDPSLEMSQKIEDNTVPIHITLFLVLNQNENEYLTSYTDGNRYTCFVNSVFDYSDIVDLKFSFERESISECFSVCFDNFQMCAYGVGDGTYDGDISKLLENYDGGSDTNDSGMDIKNCRDWILYGKYE